MKLDESGGENVFRSSELGTYLRCPRQLGYRRVMGLKVQPSATMVGGTAINDTLEEFHRQQMQGKNGLRGSALTDFFVTTNRRLLAAGETSGEPDPDAEPDGVKVLPVYERDYAPVVEPVSIQEELTLTLPLGGVQDALGGPQTGCATCGGSKVVPTVFVDPETSEKRAEPRACPACSTVTLVGHLDMTRQTTMGDIIADWKFTSKAPSQMPAATSLQLHTYATLKKLDQTELVLLRRLKTPKVETTSHFVTDTQKRSVKTLLRQVAWAVMNMFFPMTDPNSWACSPSWCGYWSICRGSKTGPLPIPGERFPPGGEE